MTDVLIRPLPLRGPRWRYDDPSGVADAPLELRLPQPLRGGVETAAAREGLTPSQWLLGLVSRSLSPASAKAV
ncbi:MAG TPA: hypothetical protein VMT74_08485 [Gaiellaceae bacterium]|nr:hypothetical protein [Gaiellaceae bacterium]